VELVGAYSNHALPSQDWRDLRECIIGADAKIRVASKAKPDRQKQKRLSTAQLEGLAEDYRSGSPVRDIAVKYQVSRDTVNSHVRRMGLPKRYPT
jgi:DNA-binding NarL/FixJ family response regulator